MSAPKYRTLLKAALPILVLLAGAGATAALIASRKAPEPQERLSLGPLVEVLEMQAADLTVQVEGQGEVSAATRVEVLAEVSGRVVSVHPRLRAGGRLRAHATLVQIDPRDYTLAVESARSAIASAETRLEQERAEAAAALDEWRAIDAETAPPELLVRGPQIRQIEAEKAAAEAQLARAELDLERTRLNVPFEAIVQSENVDPGQYLNQGRAIATLYGTAAVEIRVPLDDAELRWFDLPTAQNKPTAEVSADFAGARRTWQGTVDRLEGEVDPQTRQVHVVVRVEEPFGAQSPLLPGAFVDVAIAGRTLEGVFTLPRFALRPGGVVWILEDGKLRLREVDVLRTDRQFAYVQGGLDAGARIVTSSLEGVTDGMVVRVSEQTPEEGA